MSTRQEIESQIAVKSLENSEFRQQLIANPKAMLLQELGQEIPDDISVEVLEETEKKIYLVIPPAVVSEELSEEQLEAVAGGCWIVVSGKEKCFDTGSC
jgi:hypothetical protein